MALKSTTKIRLFVLADKEEEVFSYIQSTGVLEVTSTQTQEVKEKSNHTAEFALSKLDFSISYLSQFAPEKEGLYNSVLGERIEVSEMEVEKILSTFDWESVTEEVSRLEVSVTDADRKIADISSQVTPLESLKGCSIENVKSRFSPVFISVSTRYLEKLVDAITAESSLLEIVIVEKGERTSSLVVFADAEVLQQLKAVYVKFSATEVSVPKNESPSQYYIALETEKRRLLKEKESALLRLKKLADNIDSLKIVYDKFLSEDTLEESKVKAKKGDFILQIEGWIDSSEVNIFENSLRKKFNKVVVLEKIEKSEKEVSRVILNPSNTMAPIMEVTKMFGTPKIEEVDPTPYYSFFFLIFFGFCLTDAGYGLILIAMTSLVLSLKLPFDKSLENMIRMFRYGGVSTVIMGMLFGGWFGLTPDQVPELLTYINSGGERMFLGQIFNPMTDLIGKIMPLAYVLGIIHLSLGLYLSGLIEWKAGRKERMLFVTAPMISMFVFASLTWVAGIESFVYAFYASVLLSMWGLGGSGNPVLRLLKGAGALLNESLGWFSNILSYSRLFALGLATGIIAMAFNIVAVTMGGMVPGVGGVILSLVVLAFGHALNISLNVLGAYVHSSRLQFVEFFGMFLEGGGRVLKPLRKVCRFRHTS